MSSPLAAHSKLLAYAAGLLALEEGRFQEGKELLEDLGDSDVVVPGESLPSPRRLLADWSRHRPALDHVKTRKEKSRRPEAQDSAPGSREPRVLGRPPTAPFRNDIFVSYAHADNKDGWVDPFHTSLENRLGVLGVKARIWRDKKLSGADVFSDEILDQLKQSALLVSVLSPSAMRSNSCEKERQTFEQYAEASGGFRIGNVARALKVVMTPADGDAHRPIFGTIGYEFFKKNRQTGLYDHYFPSDASFEKLIDRLAQEIKDILQKLATAALQPTKPAIYVAEVSADLEPDRTKVVDQLK
ncbi:MAG: TIR domain-containing protein, partial [bacterium]|nr:TIR domain-containing protein [bacterium]